MSIPKGRYRGEVVSRGTRQSKDGNSEMFDIGIIAKQFFDNTVGAWIDLPEPLMIDASYFFRNAQGTSTTAIDAFAAATGWNLTEEQFADDGWQPNPIQVYLSSKAKNDGKGHWHTFEALAPFDAAKCGPATRVSTSFGSSLSAYKAAKTPGAAPAAPKEGSPF